jgi:threonine/homoserine/homoserine lactone efflux protein
MFELIFGAIGYGLLLSVMVGPVFFVLIETSILKGVKAGLFLDFGVLVSDLVYITVAFLSYQEVADLMTGENRDILRLVGGAFFLAFGTATLMKKKVKFTDGKLIKAEDLPATNYVMAALKGFTINLLNPGVLFYWFTLISVIPNTPPDLGLSHRQSVMIYIIIILLTYFTIDVLKVLGAKKLKDLLTPTWMRVINLILGVILLVFGSLFFIQGIVGIWR